MRPPSLLRGALRALLAASCLPAAGLAQPSGGVLGTPRHAAVRPAVHTTLALPALTQEQQRLLRKHCPGGAPRLGPVLAGAPTRMVVREGYALEHSSSDRIPLWVCEGVARAQLTGDVPRRDPFQPDPLLPPGVRAELADYKGSGFDRGHMAPAANQSTDPRLKDETFFLSNMAPQVGALNQQIWAVLEDTVRRWLIRRDSGHVITGGFFYDPREDDPATADGVVGYQLIGLNAVAVPTHFYKIVAARNAAGALEVIAFVMENRGYPRPFLFQPFVKPVDWIEERTGIDFFPDLAVEDQARLEAAVPDLWR